MIEALAWPVVSLVAIAVMAWLIVREPTPPQTLERLPDAGDEQLSALADRVAALERGISATAGAKVVGEISHQVELNRNEIEKLRAVLSPIATAHALRNR